MSKDDERISLWGWILWALITIATSVTGIFANSYLPQIVALIAISAYAAVMIGSFYYSGWFGELLEKHYPFFVGIPFSGFFAFAVVGCLETVRGNIKFEAVGMKFDGASGPIIMWILVFLSFVIAIKLLWPLTNENAAGE